MNENYIVKNACAKINIALDVIGKRQDGYHELKSVMYALPLCDVVTLYPESDELKIACDAELPENNTAKKAVEVYNLLAGKAHTPRIHIKKRIPSEAGLGGASADAAAVLLCMQEAYFELNTPKLYEAARMVGADVPFCMLGGTAIAEGIGEILTPIRNVKLPLVLLKPNCGISTPELFSEFDKQPGDNLNKPFDFAQLVYAINSGNIRTIAENTYNALQAVAQRKQPEIAECIKLLTEQGAQGAAMTGSGSCVFGIFESWDAALFAKQAISKIAPESWLYI